jgi:hypothetical protein
MERLVEVNEYPMTRFYVNPNNSALQATLNNNLVIIDDHQLGPLYIKAHLVQ